MFLYRPSRFSADTDYCSPPLQAMPQSSDGCAAQRNMSDRFGVRPVAMRHNVDFIEIAAPSLPHVTDVIADADWLLPRVRRRKMVRLVGGEGLRNRQRDPMTKIQLPQTIPP